MIVGPVAWLQIRSSPFIVVKRHTTKAATTTKTVAVASGVDPLAYIGDLNK